MITRNITIGILLVVLSNLIISCQGKEAEVNRVKNETLTKEERLELFLESPITINSNVNEQRFNKILFHKSYILNDNPHFNSDSDSIAKASSSSYVIIDGSNFEKEQDSLIRFASNTDIIEVFKNKYTERITYMRLNSKDLKLNYGIFIGMSMDIFRTLFPLHIDNNLTAFYRDNDSFEVEFNFDKVTKQLKKVKYLSVMD